MNQYVCPQCILRIVGDEEGKNLYFHGLLALYSLSFSVDLWMPGHYTDSNGYMDVINFMGDMYQFVVVVPVPDENSATLASYFMKMCC